MRTSHAARIKYDRDWAQPEHEVYHDYRGWVVPREVEPLSRVSWFRHEGSQPDKACIEIHDWARARELAEVAIQTKIEESRIILKMHIDPEDEESPTYSEEVWRRATDFLTLHSEALLEFTGRAMDVPNILPGPDGSIDLHWKQPRYEMLINFPSERGTRASFYGDDRGTIFIKGTLDPAAHNLGLLAWFEKKA